jgi:hypothetical protein
MSVSKFSYVNPWGTTYKSRGTDIFVFDLILHYTDKILTKSIPDHGGKKRVYSSGRVL